MMGRWSVVGLPDANRRWAWPIWPGKGPCRERTSQEPDLGGREQEQSLRRAVGQYPDVVQIDALVAVEILVVGIKGEPELHRVAGMI